MVTLRSLAIPAHAKLNLWLKVVGRRPDGYHEVDTLMQAISLHDLLIVERASSTDLEGGVRGADDLVLQAQRALESAVGRPLPARFRLVKRIPVGAGLGGGSSDAAAALRALRRLYELDCDLTPVAVAVGADVKFFLSGGAMVAQGRGDQLLPARPSGEWYALAWPGFEVSTARVYAAWDRVGGEGDNHLARAALTIEPRLAGFVAMLGDGWRMTGSGSTFFRAFPERAEAERAIASLRGCWATVARPIGAWGAI
ncbi:MAG TPA: 4-(cytidine 5'-diphospho)-2-C-methyl-D-erythritol kinase [Candidatus Dormibacteraeota bacterium]|nr:4-(cytidine 5'-diphospho)-2-C-methyl-D-erythritol kinase [Candidatus Dormibacteraeota bacterium]